MLWWPIAMFIVSACTAGDTAKPAKPNPTVPTKPHLLIATIASIAHGPVLNPSLRQRRDCAKSEHRHRNRITHCFRAYFSSGWQVADGAVAAKIGSRERRWAKVGQRRERQVL